MNKKIKKRKINVEMLFREFTLIIIIIQLMVFHFDTIDESQNIMDLMSEESPFESPGCKYTKNDTHVTLPNCMVIQKEFKSSGFFKLNNITENNG